ncbi:SDR family NAD(P)-dependent oxidoreductase [Capillimicrobium parvum]|uniref:SDR family NAD(P)-dependent oxidoreductase n=1 Tax=Capillimicrobium parvum TaxID=2884022 RepID=UPI00216AEAAA
MSRQQSERLAGRVAIVTGGTAGIGAAVCRRFVDEGAWVVAVARGRNAGHALVDELGADRAAFVAGDVSDREVAAAAVATALDVFGRLDVLVNNAGVDLAGVPILQTAEADMRHVLEVNLLGAVLMLQAAAKAMDGGGSIVNVTSRTALVGVPGSAFYGASKAALEGLSRAAAVELAPRSIRVNCVAPGLTDTAMVSDWLQGQSEEAIEAAMEKIPLRTLAHPDEVAAAIAYLASDEARPVTGASITVDGGYTAQ